MHEHGLMKGLMRQILATAATEGAARVTGVYVRLGALSQMTPHHFGEHFTEAAVGTIAEGARLDVVTSEDIGDPLAADVVLTAVDVET
jgi:hydrogenase nickel incorporation protein HypA/HybF